METQGVEGHAAEGGMASMEPVRQCMHECMDHPSGSAVLLESRALQWSVGSGLLVFPLRPGAIAIFCIGQVGLYQRLGIGPMKPLGQGRPICKGMARIGILTLGL